MIYIMFKILFFSTLFSPLLALSINKRNPCDFAPQCCAPALPCVDSGTVESSKTYNQGSLQNHQSQCCDDQQHEVQCCNSQEGGLNLVLKRSPSYDFCDDCSPCPCDACSAPCLIPPAPCVDEFKSANNQQYEECSDQNQSLASTSGCQEEKNCCNQQQNSMNLILRKRSPCGSCASCGCSPHSPLVENTNSECQNEYSECGTSNQALEECSNCQNQVSCCDQDETSCTNVHKKRSPRHRIVHRSPASMSTSYGCQNSGGQASTSNHATEECCNKQDETQNSCCDQEESSHVHRRWVEL